MTATGNVEAMLHPQKQFASGDVMYGGSMYDESMEIQGLNRVLLKNKSRGLVGKKS